MSQGFSPTITSWLSLVQFVICGHISVASALPWGLKFIVTNINEDFNNPQLGTCMHVFIHTVRKHTFHTLEKDFETDDEGS